MSKRYGPVRALNDISVTFHPGEVHAVLGENGAGKSTLMAVLSGFVRPDTGSVLLDGNPIPLGDPMGCRERGIELVHQHFTLVPEFTVEENLALAASRTPNWSLNAGRVAQPALELAEQLNWEVPRGARADDLPVGVLQRLEILKALAGGAPVLILDEPTAVLAPDEIQDLFRVLRDLRSQGKTIILIAHKLSEVFQIADRVTVLRRGDFIASALISQVDAAQVAEWMVGEAPILQSSPRGVDEPGSAFVASQIDVRSDAGALAIRELALEIPRGRIAGIGGVDGNGQVELAEALTGVRKLAGGSLEYSVDEVRIGYVPQDRQKDGLALDLSIQDNLLIRGIRNLELSRGPLLSLGAIRHWAADLVARFSVKIGALSDPVRSLSGGNQQKIVVSRTLESEVDLLVVVNPTRGLDLKASAFIHDQLRQARDRGTAILLISTDLDELAALADTAQFLSGGKLVQGNLTDALLGGAA